MRVTWDQRLRSRRSRLFLCGLAAAVVARDSSPAVATLAAARGTLFERRPVTNDVLSLSALMGARAGTDDDALITKEGQWMSNHITESRACGK
jgi:hypothetical protein